MRGITFLMALLALCAAAPLRAAEPPPAADYAAGMALHKRGEDAAARETFLKMLEAAPDSAGALEGLSVTCLALGRYAEARGYLEKWNSISPRSAYVLGLLARAQGGLRDEKGQLETYRELAALDPRDCAARTRAEDLARNLDTGAFPYGKGYRAYSMEGLDTASPQRIIYEGASGGASFRLPAGKDLYLLGGAELRREAQKNDWRNFTYYNVQEQIYSAGLGGRTAAGLGWEAEYGQSLMTDLRAPGSSPEAFGRLRLQGTWRASAAYVDSVPMLVRLSGANGRFYRVLRADSAGVSTAGSSRGWDWTARGGLTSYSGGAALGSAGLRAERDLGFAVLRGGYSRGRQAYYSASPSGRFLSAGMDVFDAGLRRTVDGAYSAGLSAARTYYGDGNALTAPAFDLTGWVPRHKEFSAGYRYALQNFRRVSPYYDSADTREHWLGLYWRRCRGYNWSAGLGYEKGFLYDSSRGYYRGNAYLADAQWYAGRSGSVAVQARKADTTVRDRSWSASLQARYSFR